MNELAVKYIEGRLRGKLENVLWRNAVSKIAARPPFWYR